MSDLQPWGDLGKKYSITEETLSFGNKCSKLGFKGLSEVPVEHLRAQVLRRAELFAGTVDFEGSEKHFDVPTPEGGVSVSVYKPAVLSKVPAVWVFFHGGGMVYGSRQTHAVMLKTIAKEASCITVNVEFRLAPEHKLPAQFDDCKAAAQWVMDNKLLIGAQADSPVGLGGDSCGGQLTASLAHDVTGLAFQVLVVPVTDLRLDYPSYDEFITNPGLNRGSMIWFIDQFVNKEEEKEDPRYSPILRPSFTSLPPALCIMAQLDPLRDGGIAYAEKLRESGVEMMIVEGTGHTFLALQGHFKQATKKAFGAIVGFINKFQTK